MNVTHTYLHKLCLLVTLQSIKLWQMEVMYIPLKLLTIKIPLNLLRKLGIWNDLIAQFI